MKNTQPETDNKQPSFIPRDKVIWDSGHGYEIGIFIKDNDFECHSGSLVGKELTAGKSELYPYSSALFRKLSKKYGYVKRFLF